MPVPDGITNSGSRHPRDRDRNRGDNKNIPSNGKGAKASEPDRQGVWKKPKKGKASQFDLEVLNPPFDPRMRRIGSPLNLTSKIKRGWIQSADQDRQRVNFLFNPSQLDLQHQIDPALARTFEQTPTNDVMDPDYPTIGSSTGVKLLYDRTYELFSAPRSGKMGFANQYGVWADVAAWYVYLGMLPAMPESWDDSLIYGPPTYKTSYLFVGPRMAYYGWVTGLNVTYSHWNQQMVPARCAVDVGFQILPHRGATTPFPGQASVDLFGEDMASWLGDYQVNPDWSIAPPPISSGE